MVDLVDYIFEFPDFATALRDSVVGPYFVTPAGSAAFQPMELLVYKDTRVNSVDAANGFWVCITTSGPNSALASSPAVQVVNDRSLMAQGLPSVSFARFDTSRVAIVFSNLGTYTNAGLQLI